MEYSEEEACLTALKYACGAVFPMVLTTAVELDLFELIKKAGNISASKLAAQLPTPNPDAAAMLDRILRLLTANSVLTCTMQDGGSERRYGLSSVGKYFTKNEDGVSFCSTALVIQEKALMECWYHLKDTILEGGTTPFERAHGVSIYGYVAKDARISKNLHMAMTESTLLYKKLIEMYKGFEGFQSVVDVGGGTGATLNIIISNHPSIKCINFDLPHVVQNAPPYPGVEHVGGDMFVSVPKGDAILMKRVMLNWSDAECVKILRNCKEAVTEKGKVVIVDFVLPEIPQTGTAGYVEQTDLQMLAYNPGAKLRTEMEFRALAKEAGFKCRLRWTNYLRPGIKRGNFTPHEEGMIIHLQALLGNKWAAIATYLPQRTDNDIKNYWNTHLKKKLKKFQSSFEPQMASDPTAYSQFVSKNINHGEVVNDSSKNNQSVYASSAENISRLLEGWMRSSPLQPNTNASYLNDSHDKLYRDFGKLIPSDQNGDVPSASSAAVHCYRPQKIETDHDSEGLFSLDHHMLSTGMGCDKSSCDSSQKGSESSGLVDQEKVRFVKEKTKMDNNNPPLSFLEKWLLDESAAQVEGVMELPPIF